MIDDPASAALSDAKITFTESTPTSRPVGGTDIVYVETTHPRDRMPVVTWKLDGVVIPNSANSRNFALAAQSLAPGKHTLSATVGDQTLTWTVDTTGPRVAYTLAEPIASVVRADSVRHYYVRDHFTMKLDPSDDMPGYVVAEFRLNGDGWYHYFGWPDAPAGTPFLFTARGTTIKEVVYGSLSSEGLSPQPWEKRVPGWGTHTIEYRARDAAGNIGAVRKFSVTIEPQPACTQTIKGTHPGRLTVSSGVTCINRATVAGDVTVNAGASLIADHAVIRGSVNATRAQDVELIGGSVDGGVRITGATGRVTLFGAMVAADVALVDNQTAQPVTIAGNRMRSLQCSGNAGNPTNAGSPNIVRSSAGGQCRDR